MNKNKPGCDACNMPEGHTRGGTCPKPKGLITGPAKVYKSAMVFGGAPITRAMLKIKSQGGTLLMSSDGTHSVGLSAEGSCLNINYRFGACGCGEEQGAEWMPGDFEESGTPCCGICDEDLEFISTEISDTLLEGLRLVNKMPESDADEPTLWFECECGETYSTTGPDVIDDGTPVCPECDSDTEFTGAEIRLS